MRGSTPEVRQQLPHPGVIGSLAIKAAAVHNPSTLFFSTMRFTIAFEEAR